MQTTHFSRRLGARTRGKDHRTSSHHWDVTWVKERPWLKPCFLLTLWFIAVGITRPLSLQDPEDSHAASLSCSHKAAGRSVPPLNGGVEIEGRDHTISAWPRAALARARYAEWLIKLHPYNELMPRAETESASPCSLLASSPNTIIVAILITQKVYVLKTQ